MALEPAALEPADSLAILQLVARADNRATARDADGYAELFTEDAVMDGDMGTAEGRDALRAAVARVWDAEPPGTLHLTLNAVFEELDGEPSVASTMLLLQPAPALSMTGVAHVRQGFRRTPTGWLISSRTITLPSATSSPAQGEEGRAGILTP